MPSDSSIHGIDTICVQQSDVMPGILHNLKYNKPFISFGSNIFDPSATHLNLAFSHGMYQVGDGRYSLWFDGEKSISLYDNLSDPEHRYNLLKQERKIAEEFESKLKAININC